MVLRCLVVLLLSAAREADKGECRASGNRHLRMLADLVVAMRPTDLDTSVHAGLGPPDRSLMQPLMNWITRDIRGFVLKR